MKLAERPLQPGERAARARRTGPRTAWRRGRSPCRARAPISSCGRGAKSNVARLAPASQLDIARSRRRHRARRRREHWGMPASAASSADCSSRRPVLALLDLPLLQLGDLGHQLGVGVGASGAQRWPISRDSAVAASPGPPAAGSRARGARHRAPSSAAAAGCWPRRASARSNASGCSRSHLRSITAVTRKRHGLDGGTSVPVERVHRLLLGRRLGRLASARRRFSTRRTRRSRSRRAAASGRPG